MEKPRDPNPNQSAASTNISQRPNLQLQKRQVSIAVKRPLLALVGDIILEYCRCLGVVSVEAAEDGINMSRPCLALVESNNTHFIVQYQILTDLLPLSWMCGLRGRREAALTA